MELQIRKVARNDPVLAADGAVRLMEKVWPSLQHVDSSSGAIGNAVNKALESLIPIVAGAPADKGIRARWLDRLWQAMTDDGVEYLSPVGDRWGELCGSAEVAGQWADELSPRRMFGVGPAYFSDIHPKICSFCDFFALRPTISDIKP